MIKDASRGLVAALPELTRDLLYEALLRAWVAFQGAWLGPSHRRMIVEREEGVGWGGAATVASPFDGGEWHDLHRAVSQFCESLPEGLRDCAALGAHVAAVRGIAPPGDRQNSLPETVSPSPFAILRELLPRVVKSFPALRGIELDLSEEHHLATIDIPTHSYWSWRQDQVERLHEQILERLPESERETKVEPLERLPKFELETKYEPEEWISAAEAEVVAGEFGVVLPLHRINKLIARKPAPFMSRKPSRQRLEVELGGLLHFLYRENRKQREAADSDRSRADQPTKSNSQKEVEELTRVQQEIRAKFGQRTKEAGKKPGQTKPNR